MAIPDCPTCDQPMTYQDDGYKPHGSRVYAKIYKCTNPSCPDSEEET